MLTNPSGLFQETKFRPLGVPVKFLHALTLNCIFSRTWGASFYLLFIHFLFYVFVFIIFIVYFILFFYCFCFILFFIYSILFYLYLL